MTEPEPPIDDELVSAVLDGEATPDERALVEGSTAGRRRLEELRAISAHVREPVEALSPSAVDRLVGRALDDLGTGRSEVTPLREAPGRSVHRWGPAVAAAAVVVIVALGAVLAITRTMNSSTDSNASSSATPTAAADKAAADSTVPDALAGEESSTAGGDSASPRSRPPIDLGTRADATAALGAFELIAVTTQGPTIEQQFADVAPASPPGCALEPEDGSGRSAWLEVATAELPTGRATVFAQGDQTTTDAFLIVDDDSCTVLLERSN